MIIFLIGFTLYFLVRYRFALVSLMHDFFEFRAQKKRKKLPHHGVVFFELNEACPEKEEKKAS